MEFGVNTRSSKSHQRAGAFVGLHRPENGNCAAEIEAHVDDLFKAQPRYDGCVAENPITGGGYLPGIDSVKLQKEVARRAIAAQRQFSKIKPADAPDLPKHRAERANMKAIGGKFWIVAEYAASLEHNGYDSDRHPDFATYAAGIMASPLAPAFIRKNEELLQKFPPRDLAGLGPGMIWNLP
jgi:hypothetical protein